jgi:hypothetical protein
MDRYLLEMSPETKNRLDQLKSHPDEPYDLVINRLIDSYEDEDSLTREEIEGIREILREMKENRSPGDQAGENPVTTEETYPPSTGDPQAVKDMEALFSGTAKMVRDEELTGSNHEDTDPGDLHEIDSYDTRGRSRTPHLDSL